MLQAKTGLPWLLLLWLPMASAFAQPDLTVGSATGRPGEIVTLPVTFANNGTVVAMSFDITFNPVLVTPGTVTPGVALAPHTVATNIPTPGTLRILVSPPIVNPLPIVKNGVLLTVSWTISASAIQANIPLNLGNVAFGNAKSAAVPAGTLTSGHIAP